MQANFFSLVNTFGLFLHHGFHDLSLKDIQAFPNKHSLSSPDKTASSFHDLPTNIFTPSEHDKKERISIALKTQLFPTCLSS